MNPDIIKQNVIKLQSKNATPQDIETYVSSASKEISPNKGFGERVGDFVKEIPSGATHVVGSVLKAPAILSARGGELAGVGIAGLASKISGNPEYYQRAVDATNKPMQIPVLGVDVKPIKDETPESVAGQIASTAALGAGGLGLSAPVAGAVGGALGFGGSSMQDNEAPLTVAGKTIAGGLLGYGAGKASEYISGKIHPERAVQNTLTSTGAATDVEAPSIASTLQGIGLKDISNPTQRAVGNNILNNSISTLKSVLSNATPDTISGEYSPGIQGVMEQLKSFEIAQKALQQVGQVPSAAPGLMSRVASGAGGVTKQALKGLGLAGLFGAGTYIANTMSQGNSPNNIIKKTISSGSL